MAVDVVDGVTVTEVVLEGLILTDADGFSVAEGVADAVADADADALPVAVADADALPVALPVADALPDADAVEFAVGKGLDAPPIGTSGQQNSSVVEY